MAGFGGGTTRVCQHGWERELTGEAQASVRGEREDAEDGMRKCIMLNTPKAHGGQAGL
jgi:hypothetical protein